MKKRLIYLLKLSILWLAFFILSRLVFLLYNYGFSLQLPIKDFLNTFFYGIKLDVSISGYLLLLLSVFMFFLTFAGQSIVKWVTRIYNLVFVSLFSIITIVDIELYRNWGFRVDSTILLYLKTPQEGLASTRIGLLILLVAATGLFIWFFLRVYKKHVEVTLKNIKPLKWYFAPVFLLLAATMIIPVRGGFGIAPINVGTVFFSQHQFANHAAVNCIWNFGESLSNRNKKQEIIFMEKSLANSEFSNLFTFNDDKPAISLIKNEKPNILIIILESFANVIIEPLGGLPDVTPQLSKIANEGVLFMNFYASGDRSDKGIVSILSGYPAQPTTSIIKFTGKSEKLPHLSKELMGLGYSTGFYYGGEINFANMKSYFVGGGYETLVTLDDFSGTDLNSKWGAHDHVVFKRLLHDLEQTSEPFFRAMFTLSSHEPFDVPHLSKFNSMDDESKYLNSIHYTDSCLGDFIQRAKQTSWWGNTWIILVADHGSRHPGNISYSSPEKFKIPMIWSGGAVRKDTIITEALSQVDIPLMIGNQMNRNFEGFIFSKDVLKQQHSFAYYAFNNGFGFLNDSSGYIWNHTSNTLVKDNSASEALKLSGKAYMQKLSEDFNSK